MLAQSVGVNAIDLRKDFLFQWMTRGVKDTESTYSYCQSSILSWLTEVCLEFCQSMICRCMLGSVISVIFLFLKHITEGNHHCHPAGYSRDVPCAQLMWMCILMLIVLTESDGCIWYSQECIFPFGPLLNAAKENNDHYACPNSYAKHLQKIILVFMSY